MPAHDSHSPENIAVRRPTAGILAACGTLLLANLLIPVIMGDVYPFTIAPMFRDTPQEYCDFRVLSVTGETLDVNDFAVRRYYDGNPIGCGVGIKPQHSLDCFGQVPSEKDVRSHIAARLEKLGRPDVVIVEQTIVGPLDERKVGVREKRTIRVVRPGANS